MSRMGNFIDRLSRAGEFYFDGILKQFGNKNVFLWAQAIAFKVLVSVVPIVVLGAGILGRFLRRDEFFEMTTRIAVEFLPSTLANYVIGFAQDLQRLSGTVTTIGIIGILITALTLFSTLRAVLSNVFREKWHTHRSVLQSYLFDLRMAVQVGLLFILTVSLSIGVQTLQIADVGVLSGGAISFIDFRDSWPAIVRTLGFFLPFALSLAMFFQLYYFTPIPRPPKRSVFLGASIAAVMWELAKQLFTHFAARLGAIKYFLDMSNTDGFAALTETFGMIVAFVLWSYYSGIVLIIGGIAVVLHESRHRVISPERFGMESALKDANNPTSDTP